MSSSQGSGRPAGGLPGLARWHVLLILAVSGAYELAFVRVGLNVLDEGWLLYAAKRLHDGAALYREVFFVFPPGHLLTAWLGYGWDPPGLVPMRLLNATFSVALAVCIYFLARRITTPAYALLAALLVAVAAPHSHLKHVLFGYRYLVFSALGLLAFGQRVSSGDRRWLFVAGLFAGVSAAFRLTPAFALGCAVFLGVLALHREFRDWLRDLAVFLSGGLAVLTPLIVWLAASAGIGVVWREVFVRPVAMTALQGLPLPPLEWPAEWSRAAISQWFTALQFRGYPLLLLAYLVPLTGLWLRAVARRERFDKAVLLAVAVWAGAFYPRALGRADIAHLASVTPPLCLLLAHAVGAAGQALCRSGRGGRWSWLPPTGLAAAVMAGWVLLFAADRHLAAALQSRGGRSIAGVSVGAGRAAAIEDLVAEIRRATAPGETILLLAPAPLLHVLSERDGPGGPDLIMPGTFLDRQEEQRFVDRLAAEAPALVVEPERPFDGMASRGPAATAPLLTEWVENHYAPFLGRDGYRLASPRRPAAHRTPGGPGSGSSAP